MKHARPDYSRIQDPASSDPSLLPERSTAIAKDEPVFLIRAQDQLAPYAVRCWAEQAEAEGVDTEMVAAARAQAKEMERWQQEHGKKLADWPL